MPLNAYEQLFLELVNRARLDPLAESARTGVGLNSGLAAGTLDGTAKQALAPNPLLNDAAIGHSLWMLATDTFSHAGAGGSNSTDRIRDAGYTLSGAWRTGENLALFGNTDSIDPARAIDSLHRQLFESPGHRPNMLSDLFRETGIGNELGVFRQNGQDYNSSIVTQVFATSGTRAFVTGVIYDDLDGDLFYDLGEGRGGATIAAGGGTTTAAAAGGYALGLAPDSAVAVDITLDGVQRSLTTDLTGGNVKLDLLADGTLLTSGDVVLGAGFSDAVVLGVAGLSLGGNGAHNRLTGGSGADTLLGAGGGDTLSGGIGSDLLVGGDGKDALSGAKGHDRLNGERGDDKLQGARGNDRLNGGKGADRLDGGEGDDRLTGGTGADRFVFTQGGDNDRITDFSAAEGDRLRLDAGLWGGGLTVAQMLDSFATQSGAGVLLDFGGDTLLIEGLRTTAALEGQIDLF